MIQVSHIARVAVSWILVVGLMAGCRTTTQEPPPDLGCASLATSTALKLGPGSGIKPPKSIYRKEPVAPPHIPDSTLAIIDAVIDEEGKPRDICVSGGDLEWGEAVAAAFREWRFEPALKDGEPVSVRFNLTTNLRRKAASSDSQ